MDLTDFQNEDFVIWIELNSSYDGMEVILLNTDMEYVATYEDENGCLYVSLVGLIDENNYIFRLYPGEDNVNISFYPEEVVFAYYYRNMIIF